MISKWTEKDANNYIGTRISRSQYLKIRFITNDVSGVLNSTKHKAFVMSAT